VGAGLHWFVHIFPIQSHFEKIDSSNLEDPLGLWLQRIALPEEIRSGTFWGEHRYFVDS
jgi:hypothetical protein